jgi:hypothetical protein
LWIERIAGRSIISGYSCGGPGEPCDPANRAYFRWGNNATRGQISKIVSEAHGFDDIVPYTQQTFTDVANTNTFWLWIERLAERGIMSGYTCGGSEEPCDPQNRPYFRPNANVTRGQIAKIVVGAAAWLLINPANSTFQDVPFGSTFYRYVETAAAHGIIAGYPCGGLGEPCGPASKPYFRWANDATRAQISKMVYLAITEVSATPTPSATSTPTFTPTPIPTNTPLPSATPSPSLTTTATLSSTSVPTTTSTVLTKSKGTK